MVRRLSPEEAIALNSWLRQADTFYLDGRLLWLQDGIDGSCVLLWLSLEQLLKLLIFQARFKEGTLAAKPGQTIFETMDKTGRKLSSQNHQLKDLIKEFDIHFPGLLAKRDLPILEKVQEYFTRRYVVNSSTAIALKLIEDIDRLFFKLRDGVDAQVPLCFIDEIAFRRELGLGHQYLEHYMQYAYVNNKFFKRRKKYPTWRVQFMPGVVHIDSGRLSKIEVVDQ